MTIEGNLELENRCKTIVKVSNTEVLLEDRKVHKLKKKLKQLMNKTLQAILDDRMTTEVFPNGFGDW